MKIKTVYGRLDEGEKFDSRVNSALDHGWKLSRREVFPTAGPFVCYAELVKLDEADMETQEAEPITWEEAVEVLRETCETAKECGTACPAFAWCQKNIPGNNVPPCGWGDPEGLEQPE